MAENHRRRHRCGALFAVVDVHIRSAYAAGHIPDQHAVIRKLRKLQLPQFKRGLLSCAKKKAALHAISFPE